jgi:transcriptional regulator with XRE-family HTH domain
VGRGKDHAAEYRVLVGMLRELRKDAGLTQAQLAERLGKPQSYVSKVERGERIIDLVEIRWWCLALDQDVTKLVREWDTQLR